MAWLKKILVGSGLKRFYKKHGDYSIYLVDGEQVRNISPDLDYFANFAIHGDIKEIPENEIWIDANLDETEKFFATATAIYELKKIKSGENFEKAHAGALDYNKKIREVVENVKHKPENTNKPAPYEVYVGKYGSINNEELSVWTVNGRLVRDIFDADFMDGGHGLAYKWIPNSEIWIEDVVKEEEKPYIILHEVVERFLMKHKKLSYDKSHELASNMEFHARKNGLSKQGILNINLNKLKGEKQ
jgi:hypothetical protein